MKIRLFVVDDHPLLRLGLARAARECDDIELVGESTPAQARKLIARTSPTVVVVGVRPPGAGALAGAARLRQPNLGIVILDDGEDPALLLRSLDAGFSAYVAGSEPTAGILAAIRHAHVCAGSFAARGLADAVHADQARSSLLSARERQVLLLLRDGHSGAVIAEQLGLSDSSVKTYVARIYTKLAVTNRSQAVVAALGRGLLPLGEAA